MKPQAKQKVIASLLRAGRPDLVNQIVITAAWFHRAYQWHAHAMSMQEALEILDLKEGADHDDVNKAFKEKAFQLHPDRGGDPNEMVKLNVARDILLGKQKSDRGGSGTDPGQYNPGPVQYQTRERPPVQKIRISWEEAMDKAAVPTTGVEWKIVTDSGSGGYGDKHSYGRVVYGTDNQQHHVFVAIYYYRDSPSGPWDTQDIETYQMWVHRVPVAQDLTVVAPKVIRDLWSNFEGCKQYNAKVYVLETPVSKKLDQNVIRLALKQRKVSFKDAMSLMGQAVPEKWTKKVDIVLEVGEEIGGFGGPEEVTLVINGKPFKLNEKSCQWIKKKSLLRLVFGAYYYPQSKKNLTKMTKSKDAILKFLLLVAEKTNEPEQVRDALRAAGGEKAEAA